jgi:hypothetical protein
VAGSIGEGQAGPGGKVLHAALALAHVFKEFQPMRMTERLRDLCQAGEHGLLGPLA